MTGGWWGSWTVRRSSPGINSSPKTAGRTKATTMAAALSVPTTKFASNNNRVPTLLGSLAIS